MMSTPIFLLLLLIFPASIICSNAEPPCDETNSSCDDCVGQGRMWNRYSNTCVISENFPCNSSSYNCTTNTFCSNGKCRCVPGLLRDGLGGCALPHGEPCGPLHNLTCAARFLLHCSETAQQCRCLGEGVDYVWDPDRKKCVGLIGSRCDRITQEGQSRRSDDLWECVQSANCNEVEERCECNKGWRPSKDRKSCLVSYGNPCDGVSDAVDRNKGGRVINRPCDRSKLLVCESNGLCGCEFYGQMEWMGGDEEEDEDNEEGCVMLVGEFCDLDDPQLEGQHKCGEDAICVPRRSGSGSRKKGEKGVCTCVEGKFQSEDGRCRPLRSHGMQCSLKSDCDASRFLTCVVVGQAGTCDCEPNGMIWSEGEDEDGESGRRKGRCVVRAGLSCSSNSYCAPNSFCGDEDFCDCDDGYVLDPANICVRESATTTMMANKQSNDSCSTSTSATELPPVEMGVTAKGLLSKANNVDSSTPNSQHCPNLLMMLLIFLLLHYWSRH